MLDRRAGLVHQLSAMSLIGRTPIKANGVSFASDRSDDRRRSNHGHDGWPSTERWCTYVYRFMDVVVVVATSCIAAYCETHIYLFLGAALVVGQSVIEHGEGRCG